MPGASYEYPFTEATFILQKPQMNALFDKAIVCFQPAWSNVLKYAISFFGKGVNKRYRATRNTFFPSPFHQKRHFDPVALVRSVPIA
jgi:hypothetical protein